MEKINQKKRIFKPNKKPKLEITRNIKILIVKKKKCFISNLLLSIFTLIFFSIYLSNEKKIPKLRSIIENYSEISITIKGGITQNIIYNSSVTKPIEVSINGFTKNSVKTKISHLEENKEIEISMKFRSPIKTLK